MWVQGITIKNKHKLLNYLRELSQMHFEKVTIIVEGREENYEKFKRLFDRNIRREGGNNNRKSRHRD